MDSFSGDYSPETGAASLGQRIVPQRAAAVQASNRLTLPNASQESLRKTLSTSAHARQAPDGVRKDRSNRPSYRGRAPPTPVRPNPPSAAPSTRSPSPPSRARPELDPSDPARPAAAKRSASSQRTPRTDTGDCSAKRRGYAPKAPATTIARLKGELRAARHERDAYREIAKRYVYIHTDTALDVMDEGVAPPPRRLLRSHAALLAALPPTLARSSRQSQGELRFVGWQHGRVHAVAVREDGRGRGWRHRSRLGPAPAGCERRGSGELGLGLGGGTAQQRTPSTPSLPHHPYTMPRTQPHQPPPPPPQAAHPASLATRPRTAHSRVWLG
ncbi:hypothetical protein B0A49_13014 [Cryomyces minteri]|uniref:Uncharacterized protein n=1 Tax=Cryomyces minteri TaxID=331657 RepID=A0A4U0V954_9PEZI|nr:hypothetical protein B0A49_13014 [Cryomyces minteri]